MLYIRVRECGKDAVSDFGKREADLPSRNPLLKRTIKVVTVQVLNHTEYQLILKFVNIWQFSLQFPSQGVKSLWFLPCVDLRSGLAVALCEKGLVQALVRQLYGFSAE